MKNDTSWMVVTERAPASGLNEYCTWMTSAPCLLAASGKVTQLQNRELCDLSGIQ